MRGPRPKSVRCPMAPGRSSLDQQQQGPVRGRWRQPCVSPQNATPPQRAPDPDTALEVARSKVSSLETALASMGTRQAPEVSALRSALSKAKQAAQERSLKVQLVHTGVFIETVTIPHPEIGSTRSRNGASEFSVAETRCAEHRI